MPSRSGPAHVVTTTRTYKDQVYRTHLLRRSYREDGKVKNETLGNLSHLPDALIEIIRRSLQGETFVPVAVERFEIIALAPPRPRAGGAAPRCAGLEMAVAARPPSPAASATWCWRWWPRASSRPHTKLATTRWWHTTTLAEDFGVADADEDDLYAAMDWLLERQDAHREEACRAPPERGRPGALRPVLELLRGQLLPAGQARLQPRRQEGHAAGQLRPAHRSRAAARWRSSVYEGNTADPPTLLPAGRAGCARQLRHRATGDGRRPRHDLQQGRSRSCARPSGVDWITRAEERRDPRAGRAAAICSWACSTSATCSSSSSPDYPGERLVACRNPELAKLRAHKREDLLAATEANLAEDQGPGRRRASSPGSRRDRLARGQGGQPVQGRQALRAGHRRDHLHLRAQARRASPPRRRSTASTSSAPRVSAAQMDAADVRAQLQGAGQRRARVPLAQDGRPEGAPDPPPHRRSGARAHLPVHARLLRRVAHARGLARADVRRRRISRPRPRAIPSRRPSAPRRRWPRRARHTLDDGTPVHSFRTLLAELATIVRNTCRMPGDATNTATFDILTTPNSLQRRARTHRRNHPVDRNQTARDPQSTASTAIPRDPQNGTSA